MHLVCGGGTGSTLMRELTDRGYDVSAGVLNALDSDEVTGRELGLPMAVEAPFSPIGDDAHAENLRLMADADFVILTAVPLGHGNARNLDAVRAARRAGTQVWVEQVGRARLRRSGWRRFSPTAPSASSPTKRRCSPRSNAAVRQSLRRVGASARSADSAAAATLAPAESVTVHAAGARACGSEGAGGDGIATRPSLKAWRLVVPAYRLTVPSQVLICFCFLSASVNQRVVTHLVSVKN